MAKQKRSTTKKTRSTKKNTPTAEQQEVPSKEMRHYAEIVALNEEVRSAYQKWSVKKDETKDLKDIYESKCGALGALISDGPDPQMPLNFSGDEAQSTSSGKPLEGWMLRPLGVLGLPKNLIIKLEAAGLETIGQLDQFWKDGHVLTDLQGIAAEKSALIADQFAAYGADHPEIYGMDPAEAS